MVLLAVAITYFVSVPIRGLKDSMGLAATLQNEKVAHLHSFLTELNGMCQSFWKMNIMLTEAKAYMPAAMLVRYTSSSDEESSGDDEAKAIGDGESARRGAASIVKSMSNSHTTNRSASLVEEPTTATATTNSALRTKRVAVLAINMQGFTTLTSHAPDSISMHISRLLTLIATVADGNRGVMDSFHGDHFVISFNAAKTVGSAARKAVQCAAQISKTTAGTPYHRLAMGIGCGTAVVGSLGTATQRRLSIIGSCYTRALTLQRLSATLEASLRGLFSPTEAPICYECIIDEPTRSECPENCPNVCVGTVPRQGKASVGLVTVSQDPTEKQSVYGVVFNDEPEPDSKGHDEWMYEMHAPMSPSWPRGCESSNYHCHQ